MEFYQIYRPLTASPHSCDDTYREYEPCEALKPYPRSFAISMFGETLSTAKIFACRTPFSVMATPTRHIF